MAFLDLLNRYIPGYLYSNGTPRKQQIITATNVNGIRKAVNVKNILDIVFLQSFLAYMQASSIGVKITACIRSV